MSSIIDTRTLKNYFQAVSTVQTFRKQHTMNDCFEKHLNIYSYWTENNMRLNINVILLKTPKLSISIHSLWGEPA